MENRPEVLSKTKNTEEEEEERKVMENEARRKKPGQWTEDWRREVESVIDLIGSHQRATGKVNQTHLQAG